MGAILILGANKCPHGLCGNCEQAVGTSSKKRVKRCRDLLLELIAALQQVMPPGVYLSSLIRLARTAPDRIACKALRLINSSLPQLSPAQVRCLDLLFPHGNALGCGKASLLSWVCQLQAHERTHEAL